MELNLNVEALLARQPLFSGLSPEERSRISQDSRVSALTKGELLFQKGDTCLGMHLVLYGQIKLAFTSPQGNEKVVEIISQGQSFGEAVMFMEKPYPVFAQALVDTQLLFLPSSTLFGNMERDPGLCKKMIASLSSRLHRLVADVESYSLHSGKQRVIGYLLREAPEPGPDTQEVTVQLSTSKGTIASRLNLTQEHFSRILHELSDEQLIRVEGRKIHILNLAQLQRFD